MNTVLPNKREECDISVANADKGGLENTPSWYMREAREAFNVRPHSTPFVLINEAITHF